MEERSTRGLVRAWFSRWFQIEEPDVPRTLWLFLQLTFIGVFYTVAGAAGEALLLSGLGAGRSLEVLPFVFMAGTAVSAALTAVYDAAHWKVSRLRLMVGFHVLLALSVVFLRAMVHQSGGAVSVLFGVVVWNEACAQTSIMLFYSYAGDFFTTRQARSCFGFISGGLAMGTFLAGHLVHWAAAAWGVANLLPAAAVSLLAAAACAWAVRRSGPPPCHSPSPDRLEDRRAPVHGIFRDVYLRWVTVMALVACAVFKLVEFQFQISAARAMSNEELAEFFGTFFAHVGTAQLLFLAFFSHRVIRRFGAPASLVALPALLVATCAASCASPTLFFASVSNFVRVTLYETMDIPARQLLFLPLSHRLRLRAQAIFTGALLPLGNAVGGVILLCMVKGGVELKYFSAAAAVLSGVWLASLLRLRPLYGLTLSKSLKTGYLDTFDTGTALERQGQSDIRDALMASLDRGRPSRALDLAEQGIIELSFDELFDIAGCEDARSASKAWDIIRKGKDGGRADLFIAGAGDPRPTVRAAAISAYGRHWRESASPVLETRLADPDPGCRVAAASALLRYGGFHGALVVHPFLDELSDSTSEPDRVLHVQILEKARNRAFLQEALRRFSDPSPAVRRAAVRACGAIGDVVAVPAMLRLLEDPECRSDALRAIQSMPRASWEALARFAGADSADPSVAVLVTRSMAVLGGGAAAASLWRTARCAAHPTCRREAARLLRGGAFATESDREDVLAQVRQLMGELSVVSEAGRRVPEGFVRRALREEGDQLVRHAFSLLIFHFRSADIRKAEFHFFSRDRSGRDTAVELLKTLLPPAFFEALDPAFGPPARASEGRLTREARPGAPGSRAGDWTAGLIRCSELLASQIQNAGGRDMNPSDAALLHTVTMASILKETALFGEIPTDQLKGLAEECRTFSLYAGETLFHEGEPADAFYLVREGAVSAESASGTAVKRAGEWVGETAVWEKLAHTYAARAVEDSALVRVPAFGFANMLDLYPEAVGAILAAVAARLRELEFPKRSV